MESIRKFEILEDEALLQLDKFVTIPTIIFNSKEVLYLNESCKKILEYEENDLNYKEVRDFINCLEKEYLFIYNHNLLESTTDTVKQEILINKNSKESIWVEFTGKIVIYHEQKTFIGHLYDISDKKVSQLNLSRTSKLRDLMLEVTQSILKMEDINQIFQLILNNSLIALENSTLGTIFIREDDCFKVVASVGFVDDIKNFKLHVEGCFLYKATDGKMDRIVNIRDLTKYNGYDCIKANIGEGMFIKSTMSVPIYHEGSFFGMINIDSVEKNAFDEDDVKSMEFIRNNAEIAVSNYLLYKEKAFLAKHDQLTGLYNRYYFEESFLKLKEKEIQYNETFQLVVFDIDGLKKINDSMGHLIGDEVIKKIAQSIKSSIRKSDIIARVGGDEFSGIIFVSNKEYLVEKFQKILKQLENDPLLMVNEEIICTFSYGIASFPQEGIELNELIKIADERMYSYKKIN
jgi:diguanylate cyclase (GGDEF)-like protein